MHNAGAFGPDATSAQVVSEVSSYSDFAISQLCEDYRGLQQYVVPQSAVLEGSAKMRMLQPMLQQLQKDGHRTLVFSQWTSMLDLLEVHFRCLSLFVHCLALRCLSLSVHCHSVHFTAFPCVFSLPCR